MALSSSSSLSYGELIHSPVDNTVSNAQFPGHGHGTYTGSSEDYFGAPQDGSSTWYCGECGDGPYPHWQRSLVRIPFFESLSHAPADYEGHGTCTDRRTKLNQLEWKGAHLVAGASLNTVMLCQGMPQEKEASGKRGHKANGGLLA
ncbi:hypothetical protein BS50DRAFT_630553 [Corynespora cassiicola Philippines]|uniref:Uncharacterized protein n=1 Tax=Corynespora cassiicola Philippines TaxID=1448308 RepID=A0A2T2P4V7_CORCC|nr:hypothetical protein BS50DRAFT_630553 [Corynespora cassiicola Philippines]